MKMRSGWKPKEIIRLNMTHSAWKEKGPVTRSSMDGRVNWVRPDGSIEGRGDGIMLSAEEVNRRIEENLQNGETLVVAAHADLPSIKELLDQCLKEDIPAVLGPCASGG